MIEITKVSDFAKKAYNDANCVYGDGQDYMVHVDMVVNTLIKHIPIFNNLDDAQNTIAAAYCHDLVEDAKLSYNNILEISNKDVADIVLAVTDVNEANRLLRHLNTMGRTVKDYRAIILKLCDIYANASYSKEHGSSMYAKYVEEYQYRRPIFKKALNWYPDKINPYHLIQFWLELDKIHWGDKAIIYNSNNTVTLL
jgi:(p)ppGpp synthase/HD superfamily hydrolase